MWYSNNEYQEFMKEWEGKQVLAADLDIMTEKVTRWIDVCKVSMIDLDLTNVPHILIENAAALDYILPVLKCIQSPNARGVPEYIDQIRECLGIEYQLEHPQFTISKVLECDIDDGKREFIIELKIRADEERKLKDLYKGIYDSYMTHKIPTSKYKQTNNIGGDKGADKIYIQKKDEDDEYDYVDDKVFRLKQLLLSPYKAIINDDTKNLIKTFNKYLSFLNDFSFFQKFWFKCDDFFSINLSEFQREFNSEMKRINQNDTHIKNITKNLKDNQLLNKYIEYSHDRVSDWISSGLTIYEHLFKAIDDFMDNKRKDYLKFYFLSNEELFKVLVTNSASESIKNNISKFMPGIKKIEYAVDNEENVTIYGDDGEVFILRINKSKILLKEVMETFETEIGKKILNTLRQSKKEIKEVKNEIQKLRELAGQLVKNKDYLAQALFTVIYSGFSESIDKALKEDEIFDKLLDIKAESKERKKNLFALLKNPNSTEIEKKKAINLICCENYFSEIIKNLIREDTASNTDFNWTKNIMIKADSDDYKIVHLNFSCDYGFQYVGLFNNFVITPQTERVFITMTNNFNVKRPMFMYSLPFAGKRETIKMLSKIFGIVNLNFHCSSTFDVKSYRRLVYFSCKAGVYNTVKSGFWLTLDTIDNLKIDVLSVIAQDIMSIYQNLSDATSEMLCEENKIRMLDVDRNFQIFCLSGILKKQNISFNMKNYFRLIGLMTPDLLHFILCSLRNYRIPDYKIFSRKIKLTIEFFNNKTKILQGKNIGMSLFNKFFKFLSQKIKNEFPDHFENIVKDCLINVFTPILTSDEYDDLSRYLNFIFNTQTKKQEKNSCKEEIVAVAKEILQKYFYNNQLYRQKMISVRIMH